MSIKKSIDRRKFLQDSALCLGAGSLTAGAKTSLTLASAPASGIGTPVSSGPAGDLQMKASFSPSQVVWIVRQRESGLEQKMASRELARGLRNLGLGSEPIEAGPGTATPASRD